ncbi:hypothetical protein D3C81_2296820 [compost metagenome]
MLPWCARLTERMKDSMAAFSLRSNSTASQGLPSSGNALRLASLACPSMFSSMVMARSAA